MIETIVEVIKAFFFTKEGNVDNSVVAKVKEIILWALLGAAALIAAIMFIPDDETSNNQSEQIEYINNE